MAHGQVWRLFTYLLEPYGFSGSTSFVLSVLFLVIQVNLFFLFGRSLERAWGTFRFNMYFFSGYLLNIIAALILYLCPFHIAIYDSGFQYVYWAMFFAFALIQPDTELLLYFVLPIKVKWLAAIGCDLYVLFDSGQFCGRFSHDGNDSRVWSTGTGVWLGCILVRRLRLS